MKHKGCIEIPAKLLKIAVALANSLDRVFKIFPFKILRISKALSKLSLEFFRLRNNSCINAPDTLGGAYSTDNAVPLSEDKNFSLLYKRLLTTRFWLRAEAP